MKHFSVKTIQTNLTIFPHNGYNGQSVLDAGEVEALSDSVWTIRAQWQPILK